MKIQKILFTAFVALGVCTSCTEESLVDGGGSNNAAGTINLALTTDFIQTKAADGYTYATGDEIKINDCAVSIYQKKSDGTAGDQVGYAWANFSGTANGNYDNKEAYVFNNVTTKTGNVIILVAANTGIWTSADGLQGLTYADFKKKSVSNTATTGILFDATNLVKFGEKDTTLSANTDNVHVALSQLAARVDLKVKVTDNNSESSKWSFAMSSLKVENINTASDLFLETYNTSNYTYNSKKALGSFNASSLTSNEITFYTYEKKNNDSNLAIQLSGRLTSLVQANTYSDKTYKITLNPTVSDKVTTNGFIHGNVYDVTGNIIPSENAITFDVTVKPWTIVNIDASLKNIHYLAVSEHTIYMPNILTYTFSYASDLDVNDVINSVKYTGYDISGNTISGTYSEGDDQYPTVTFDKTNKTITVSFVKVPINYVPTHISLTIKTVSSNLSETVNIIHYPPIYVDAYQNTAANAGNPSGTFHGGVPTGSALPGGGNGVGNNSNVFCVTTIASSGFVIGDPKVTGDLEAGYWAYTRYSEPTKYFSAVNDATITGRDAESNQKVSPKFVIASQWGTTYPLDQAGAEMRCYLYTEYYNGKLLTNWRMPTKAELEYIHTLQADSNSAVQHLLDGYWYRSAYKDDPLVHVGTDFPESEYVRCVHDVY